MRKKKLMKSWQLLGCKQTQKSFQEKSEKIKKENSKNIDCPKLFKPLNNWLQKVLLLIVSNETKTAQEAKINNPSYLYANPMMFDFLIIRNYN